MGERELIDELMLLRQQVEAATKQVHLLSQLLQSDGVERRTLETDIG